MGSFGARRVGQTCDIYSQVAPGRHGRSVWEDFPRVARQTCTLSANFGFVLAKLASTGASIVQNWFLSARAPWLLGLVPSLQLCRASLRSRGVINRAPLHRISRLPALWSMSFCACSLGVSPFPTMRARRRRLLAASLLVCPVPPQSVNQTPPESSQPSMRGRPGPARGQLCSFGPSPLGLTCVIQWDRVLFGVLRCSARRTR